MIKPGRFSHQLIDLKHLDVILPLLQEQLHPIWMQYNKGILADFDLVISYILISNSLRRPKDFLGGIVKFADSDDLSFHKYGNSLKRSQEISSIKLVDWLILIKEIKVKEKILNFAKKIEFQRGQGVCKARHSELTLVDFFCNLSHRSIPLSVNRALMGWAIGKYPLDLCFEIPTPMQVFGLQLEGRRCVSLLNDFNINSKYNNSRDPLGFLLHDLIHADNFFSNPFFVRGQTKFLNLINRNIQKCDFEDLNKDTAFANEFNYLISDMNSHPAHLLKTFIAIVRQGLIRQSRLCSEQNKAIILMIEKWDMPTSIFLAVRNIIEERQTSSSNLELFTNFVTQ